MKEKLDFSNVVRMWNKVSEEAGSFLLMFEKLGEYSAFNLIMSSLVSGLILGNPLDYWIEFAALASVNQQNNVDGCFSSSYSHKKTLNARGKSVIIL